MTEPHHTHTLDFRGDANALRVHVEGERLAHGHLSNPAFAAELSKVDPLPHQRIAVYQRMLPQEKLRFLLADDAGAGKTIMTGLYVRERLLRHALRRVLIVAPAGLVGNWRREMHTLFQLPFSIVTGDDAKKRNPFCGKGSDFVVVSIDSLRTERLFECLRDPSVVPYDLAVFDEAHKLSVSMGLNGVPSYTGRYRLAEAIAGVRDVPVEWRMPWSAQNILLLTATPHMGKEYPYYCLWRLLDEDKFNCIGALKNFPDKERNQHFIRRVKEEMVTLDGKPLYPERVCETARYAVGERDDLELALYERTTEYILNIYNQASILNPQAARLVLQVFQRRMASSAWALLCSLRKRLDKLQAFIEDIRSGRITESELQSSQRNRHTKDLFEETDASDIGDDDLEHDEEEATSVIGAQTIAELSSECDEVRSLVKLAEAVYNGGKEAKFARLRALLKEPRFYDKKIIIYTEHRDTLEFLKTRFDGLGYTGKIASIHGGMGYAERDAQVEHFRAPHGAGQPGAQIFIGTDAAAEGVNLQFCSTLLNYDVPWNPARLEQRMGRIHRYGQKEPQVFIINLVAGNTREGDVIGKLLDKLEEIRKALGSDKVFDVIGRIFDNLSIADCIREAVTAGDTGKALEKLNLDMAAERVRGIQDAETSIYGAGGEVAAGLPALRASMDTEDMRRLLPGHVRSYLEHAAPIVGLSIDGDLDGVFKITAQAQNKNAQALLYSVLTDYPADMRESLTLHKGVTPAIYVHPGEPFFDGLEAAVRECTRSDALRGAIFSDVQANEPYFFHAVRISAIRVALAPEHSQELFKPLGTHAAPQVVEQKLIGLQQFADGRINVVPIERMLLFTKTSRATPDSVSLINGKLELRDAAQKFAQHEAEDLAVRHRKSAQQHAEASVRRILTGFDYEASELAQERKRLKEKVERQKNNEDAAQKAAQQLEDIKRRQRTLDERRQKAINTVQREAQLTQAGEAAILATALVQPSQDPQDVQQHFAEAERIAMRVAIAYEEKRGFTPRDVSTAPLATQEGLEPYPGYDLLSRIYDDDGAVKEKRCIEVKGRAGTGSVTLSENEWSKANTLRKDYWLYAIFNCASEEPQLFCVQDPWGNLWAKAVGGVVVSYGDIAKCAHGKE